jgi:hypothetical protein
MIPAAPTNPSADVGRMSQDDLTWPFIGCVGIGYSPPRSILREEPLRAGPVGSIEATGMAAYGASRSLPDDLAKVP